jgi:hypothetical protein
MPKRVRELIFQVERLFRMTGSELESPIVREIRSPSGPAIPSRHAAIGFPPKVMKPVQTLISFRWMISILFLLLGMFVPVYTNEPPSEDAQKPKELPKAGEARWNIIAECQMVVLPQKVAFPLIPDLSDDDKIEAAWTKIQQMIEHGEANLVADLNLRGEAGVRLVSESIKEMRYATEYTPPQLPDKVPKEKAVEVLKNWPHVGIVPTAFETRNVGATLDLQAAVSDDGQWVALNVVPQHVRLLRLAKIDAGVLPSGERLSVEQPQFTTLRNSLSMQVRTGQRLLLGVHEIPEDEDHMELFFLRVRVQKTGESK